MDSLATPGNMDRQTSTQSTTPLLNSVPSTEGLAEPPNGAAENGNGLHTNDVSVAHAENGVGRDGVAAEKVLVAPPQNGSAHEREPGRIEPESGSDLYTADDNRGTVIPIREEIRCRRFWFFYHDLRALTTSVS